MPKLENIKHNSNNFSFTGTVASLVNNKEYASGYLDLLNGKKTDKSYFWEALSAVGEEVGSVIYENVLNYVNNVSNINTCRLRALTSIAKVLGVTEFSILKNLNSIPEDVLKLMDIFSINRKYILNINTFNSEFVQDLINSTLNVEDLIKARNQYFKIIGENEEDSSENENSTISIIGSISNEKYEKYIEECFFKLLSEKIFQTYGNDKSDFIYSNLSSQGNFSINDELVYSRSSEVNGYNGNNVYNKYWTSNLQDGQLPSIVNDYSKTIYRYKKSFNIPNSFNETKIVDDIENGLDFLDNYQGGELSVLNLEIQERSKTKFSPNIGYSTNRLDTRYSYYNEKEVKQYIKFIDDIYILSQTKATNATSIDELSTSYLNWTPYYLGNKFSPYWLDTNFSNLSIESYASLSSNIASQYSIYNNEISNVSFSSFVYDYYGNIYSDEVSKNDKKSILSKFNVIRIVSQILKDICLALVNIREGLKTQSQRNYMTGTKLLIEYILDEYLINTLINTYGTDPEKTKSWPVGGHPAVGTQIIEYIDTTEYYNIGNLTDKFGSIKSGVNLPYYENLEEGGFNGVESGKGLIAEDIRNYYLSTLNIGNGHYISSDKDYYDFMSAVYEVGISKTYRGKDGAIYVNRDDLVNELSTKLYIDKISSAYNFSESDYNFLKNNWYYETSAGYRLLNYEILSNYLDVISSNLSSIENDIETYNSALSTRYEQQSQLILKYHGDDVAYYPWYNYKNTDYPTFQSHPYLYNFVEHSQEEYPIENAFYGNSNEDLIYELQSENISVYLGEFGQLRNIWRNSNFDYSGYKSRYENSLHNYGSSNTNGLYSVTHYDGIFYPPAIDLYKKYALHNLYDDNLKLQGFDLLSVHMLDCVENGYYDNQRNLDIPQISSLWHYYSHLNLTRSEREFIVNQLINLSSDILNVADSKYRLDNKDDKIDNVEIPYDIYKYGLDYNNNSIILLKRYYNGNSILENNLSSVSQKQKKETLGELWIKFNSHPIGFPAFLKGNLSSYSQVLLNPNKENVDFNYTVINNVLFEANTSNFGSKQSVNNVYDFDIARNGNYLIYAVENPSNNVLNKSYKNSVSIASKIIQRKQVNYSSPEEEIKRFILAQSGPTFLYPTNDGVINDFNQVLLSNLSESDYEFDGYFQNSSSVYAGYIKRNKTNGLLSSVSVNVIEYPSLKIASRNSESNSFLFNTSYNVKTLSTDFAKTNETDQIRLGFIPNGESGPTFTLVVANEIIADKKQYIQDFIGFNNQRLSNETELSSGYGFTDYVEATSGIWNTDNDKNCNSFDRFSHLISIYDIPESYFYNGIQSTPMVYALNSDASYIPLYYGVNGQNLHYKLKNKYGEPISYNRQWHINDNNIDTEYVARHSLELLGYSYQNIDKLIKDKENLLYKDEETGKITSLDSKSILNGAIRVYENYTSADMICEVYNDYIEWKKTDNDTKEISFRINLNGLNKNTAENYNILLLNTNNGKDRNPIVAGILSEETLNNIFYDEAATLEEDNIIMYGSYPTNKAHIVGTPNPFNRKDTTFGLDYTNHINNINGFSTKLEWDGDIPTIKIELKRNNNSIDFSIQSETLLLFVYKNDTYKEFEEFHYMEPFSKFPHNAAISNWNIPWKDKTHAWMYMNGWSLSDAWQPVESNSQKSNLEFFNNSLTNIWENNTDYQDKRNTSFDISKGYKQAVFEKGTDINAVVGHLPISAYNSDINSENFGKLSIDLNDERLTNLSLMENIELTSLKSLNDSYYLSTGQITWKISEEDNFNYLKLKYPPKLIDMLLYDKFHGVNKEHLDFKIFELSNTYIFQLEDPIKIAEKIGTVAIPVGTVADEFTRVYEDYLDDKISTDVNGVNFAKYRKTFFDVAETPYDGDITDEEITEIIENELTAINNEIQKETNINSVDSKLEQNSYFVNSSEKNNKTDTIDYYLLSATPEEVSDYLKIYVNWRKYNSVDHDEIELFFNLQNLFFSPYSYKTSNGSFTVEYKNNTYINLKSGEDGYLYIIFQFKYYDSSGTLCGIRDLPILTYHIFNVSDDKPKFMITKSYEIDNRSGIYTYPKDGDNNIVYITVDSLQYTRQDNLSTSIGEMKLGDIIGYNYNLTNDVYFKTKMSILSPIQLKYLNVELLYNRGILPNSIDGNDPEIIFEPTLSKNVKISDYNGNISINFDDKVTETDLNFTVFAGTKINEDTYDRIFPIEIANAYGEDINGNKPKFVFINGDISLKLYDDDSNDVEYGAYLARELNINPEPVEDLSSISDNKYHNAGWIYDEQKSLIKLYSVGNAGDMKILAELPGGDEVPLKTTGIRETRFDTTNNLFLIEETINENI